MIQDDTDLLPLGEAVKRLRKSHGMTQPELAVRAGCSTHAVWEMEVRTNGTVAMLERLTSAMGGRWVGLPKGSGLTDRVALARRRADLSFDVLARRTGISKTALIRLERGKARVATLQAVLPVIAPRCTVRRPDYRVLPGADQDVRFTPADMLTKLIRTLGPIGLDPCGDSRSFVRAKRVYFEGDDGLSQDWICRSWVYVNPPFSNAAAFVKKGVNEWKVGHAKRVLFLLKGQTHGRLLHDIVHPVADVLLLRDRIAFVRPDGKPSLRPNFGCSLIALGFTKADVMALTRVFSTIHLPPALQRKTPRAR
jgi:transcriptional regulator with XRE-family HTH domain